MMNKESILQTVRDPITWLSLSMVVILILGIYVDYLQDEIKNVVPKLTTKNNCTLMELNQKLANVCIDIKD